MFVSDRMHHCVKKFTKDGELLTKWKLVGLEGFGTNPKDSSKTKLLIRFRDNALGKTLEGKEIIRLYYEWSPLIVKSMDEDEQF